MEKNKTVDGKLSLIDNDYSLEEAINFQNEVLTKKSEEFKKEKALSKAEDVIERKDSLEIMPINLYVLVKPYEVNPYQKLEVSEEGLALNSLDRGRHISNETGEEEKADMWSRVGQVIEASPLCKFVKEGDVVMYRKQTAVPIPFLNLGMEVVAENAIQVVINEKLKERFLNLV